MKNIKQCAHWHVETYRNDKHGIGFWACFNCKLRFYPACNICITVGHRKGHEEHEADIAAGSGSI